MPIQTVGGSDTVEGGIEQLTELLAGKIGTAAKLHAYLSTFAPSVTSVEADFEGAELSVNGYAPIAIVWGTPGINSLFGAVAQSNDCVITVGGPLVTNPGAIGGFWIEEINTVGPPKASKCVKFFSLSVPVAMTEAFKQVSATVTLMSSGNGYVVVNS